MGGIPFSRFLEISHHQELAKHIYVFLHLNNRPCHLLRGGGFSILIESLPSPPAFIVPQYTHIQGIHLEQVLKKLDRDFTGAFINIYECLQRCSSKMRMEVWSPMGLHLACINLPYMKVAVAMHV